MTIDNLPSWTLPALAGAIALLAFVWVAFRLRRRWVQGRQDLAQARIDSRAHQTGREGSLGPLTPDPEVGQDL